MVYKISLGKCFGPTKNEVTGNEEISMMMMMMIMNFKFHYLRLVF